MTANRERRALLAIVGALLLLQCLAWWFAAALGGGGLAGYAPLHTVLETFSIVVCVLVFAVGWHAHGDVRRRNLVLIAVAFLCVALLDLLHTLSFPGMPALVTPSGPEKAINFWLAARTVAFAALFAVGLLSWRVTIGTRSAYLILVAGLAVVAVIGWMGLYRPDALPRVLVPGAGPTPLAIGFEYGLITLCVGAAMLFYRMARRQVDQGPDPALDHKAVDQRSDEFDELVLRISPLNLFAAGAIMVMSQLFFTLYVDVTDAFTLLGHVYKVIAAVFVYRSILITNVRAPFVELSQTRDALSDLFNHTPCGFHAVNPQGVLVNINDTELAWLGYRRDEVVGKMRVTDLYVPEFNARVREGLEEIKTQDGAREVELEMRRKDGSTFPVLATGTAVRDAAGGFVRSHVSIFDISERKSAERALAEAHEQREQFVLSAIDAIISVDHELRIVTFNPAAEAIFQCAAKDAIGAPLDRFIPQRFRSGHADHMTRFATSGDASRRMGRDRVVTGLRANGEEFPLDASISHVIVNGRSVYTAILRDITERQRDQQALRELGSAMETLREAERKRIAQELHDDLGQQLVAMKMDIALLRQKLPADQDGLVELAASLERGANAAVISTRRMLADLRPAALDEFGLVAALEELAGAIATRHGMRFVFEAPAEPLNVDDRIATPIYRMVQESLNNVAKHADAQTVTVSVKVIGGDLVVMVRDDGRGMTEADRRKQSSYGLLGIRERAYSVGGVAEITSAVGAGTQIELRIPLAGVSAYPRRVP